MLSEVVLVMEYSRSCRYILNTSYSQAIGSTKTVSSCHIVSNLQRNVAAANLAHALLGSLLGNWKTEMETESGTKTKSVSINLSKQACNAIVGSLVLATSLR